MPLYNFMRQFAPNVVAGLAYQRMVEKVPTEPELAELIRQFNVMPYTLPKRQTIRAERKRPTKPGERLYLYTGMRTKQCVKLGEAVCKTVEPIRLWRMRTHSGGCLFPPEEKIVLGVKAGPGGYRMPEKFARLDGFQDAAAMMKFFKKTHGLPFTGELITW